MAHSHVNPPQGTPADSQPASRDVPPDELVVQARAAADQAIQLAKLAEESARLARHLNEQVVAYSGHSNVLRADPDNASIPASDRAPLGPTHSETPADSRIDQPAIQILSVPPRRSWHRSREKRKRWNSIVLSTTLHLALLAALGLLTFVIQSETRVDTIQASFAEEEESPAIPLPVVPEQEEPFPAEALPVEPELAPEDPPLDDVELAAASPDPKMVEPPDPTARNEPEMPAEQAGEAKPAIDLAKIGSRSEAGKALLLERFGGTAESEAAVYRALDWFVHVQRRDGSWDFNDIGAASHAGSVSNPMGATSYVLLAFLGAGQTHRQGKYRAQVGQAISFLLKHARRVPAGVDLRGPNVEEHHNFYVQGAAAMALCEAFIMTKDRRLRVPVQGAIDFIVAAQDPQDGGWRYKPFEPGCTSVTTLQVTALISAQRAGLKVPDRAFQGARHFYTTVRSDGAPNGRYCYRAAEPSFKSASTAQAAVGRMYLRATKDDADLQAAIAILDNKGPYENRYYCYYATLAMKNWEGDEWNRWNASMREELIRTQVIDEGPAYGSWTPLQRGATDTAGGRLLNTALSTMTLEVYYRYLPLYDALDGDGQSSGNATEVAAENVSNVESANP